MVPWSKKLICIIIYNYSKYPYKNAVAIFKSIYLEYDASNRFGLMSISQANSILLKNTILITIENLQLYKISIKIFFCLTLFTKSGIPNNSIFNILYFLMFLGSKQVKTRFFKTVENENKKLNIIFKCKT